VRLRDLNHAAVWAGLTAFVWYAFGGIPLQIAVGAQLALTSAQTSSWIFIVWSSGAVLSIALSLRLRQPIPITWTLPGLVYLGTLAERFSFAELVGANLIGGILILVLGVLGVGGAVMRWLPLPIIMGMFAGSIVPYVTQMVAATVHDVAIAGMTVGGYLIGRAIGNPRVPPVGLAVVAGGLAVAWAGTPPASAFEWTLPTLAVPDLAFSLPAVVAVTIPMVVFALALGNVQGLGFLRAQGYPVPANAVTTAVGVASILNALLGGHVATVARNGVAILASSDAGPVSGRYWAVVISSGLTLLLALAAMPAASLLGVLPKSYVFAVAALAIVSALQDALEKSFGGEFRFGALVAFIVAATPFALLGMTSAFWALLAGILAAGVAERRQLLTFWRRKELRERYA
jgi:benzoate membrane transport protein